MSLFFLLLLFLLLLTLCVLVIPSYPLLYLPQRREGVWSTSKGYTSLVRKCLPANLQNHWPKSSFGSQDHRRKQAWPRPWRLYIALSLNSLAGTGLNCTSDWIFPCESYYYMGHIFYHNPLCNYLKYHVCLFSLLQPINVYLINVKKKCGLPGYTWVKKTTKEQI